MIKMKEESEKAGLKLNVQKTKIMASSSITSWPKKKKRWGGEEMENKQFIFLGSRITEDSDCRHELRRCLLLGRKAMTNLDRLSKSRDITLSTKVCIVKAMIFPAVMMDVRVGT